VTGTVVFGHSLVSSASAHYAQDSGGGGYGPGVIGWALAAQASGTGTINAFIMPYPYYYSLATSIIRTQTKTDISAGASVTAIASAISDGSNRLMLVFGIGDSANKPVTFKFNTSEAFTQLQAGNNGVPFVGHLASPTLTTANIIGDYSSITTGYGFCIEVFLNGVYTVTPVGTLGTGSGSSTTPSLVVSCSPGDLVIGTVAIIGSATITGGRAAGQTNLADVSNGLPRRMATDYAIASGSSFTFTWTISSSLSWYTAGVAVKSA